jgi:peptide/nickel transport system substrate-binding protein
VKLRPALATSWEISEDARVFTFNLRKGVKFHDGTPFNAQAVKFNFDRINHLKKGFYWMLSLSKLEKVEVVDDYTVRFVLAEPFSLFLRVIEYFPMASPTDVRKHEEKKGDYAATYYVDRGVGTGPYIFKEWQHGVKIVMEKYDGYWGGWKGNHSSRVINWMIPEAGTQRMMVEKGELDLIQIFTIDDFERMKKNPDLVALEKPSMAPNYIRLNCATGPTKDVRVRKAVSYSLNRELYEEMLGTKVIPSDGPSPKELLDGWVPKNLIREYNPEKAKKLLAEAGYPNGFEMSVIIKKGAPRDRVLAEVWQVGLAKAGIKLNIQVLPWPAIRSKLAKWRQTRDPATGPNSYIQFLGARLPDPYAYIFTGYHSEAQTGKGRNWMLYSNPKVDQVAEKAVRSTDPEERMRMYREAIQMITDDAPDVFVQKLVDRVVMRKEVKGFYFDLLYPHSLGYFDMYKVGP